MENQKKGVDTMNKQKQHRAPKKKRHRQVFRRCNQLLARLSLPGRQANKSKLYEGKAEAKFAEADLLLLLSINI